MAILPYPDTGVCLVWICYNKLFVKRYR